MEGELCQWEWYQDRQHEVCPAQPQLLASEIESRDLWISGIGLIAAVYFLYRSKELEADQLSTGRVIRVFSDHFRFLLILYTAYETRMEPWQQVLFDLVFPVYNLSLGLYPKLTLPVLSYLQVSLEGCESLLAWNLLLLGVVSVSLLPFFPRYTYLSYFNLLSCPDTQLAVSLAFSHYTLPQTTFQALLCFTTSLQWSLFSLLLPATTMSDSQYSSTSSGKQLYSTDFREGCGLWTLVIKSFQVLLICSLHFVKVYFRQLPGYGLAGLLLLITTYRQIQGENWPYTLRLVNFISDDSTLSIVLLTLWTRWRSPWLVVAAFWMPVRQSWRVVYSNTKN